MDSEAEANQVKSLDLVRNVEKSNMLASDLLSNLNTTNVILDEETKKTDLFQKSLDEFENSNNNIN